MSEWISREITPEIQSAIEATDRSTYVFYVAGEGGTGKTILLRQIGMRLKSPDGIESVFPWSGILDLYHSDVNTNSGLERQLSRVLERTDEFQEYWAERESYTARREAGETGGELEEERAELSDLFAQCMNQVTLYHRVIVALDTTERIQYETDEIQKLCGQEKESTTVKVWLSHQLQRWQNCVVLLAGRPDQELEMALAQAPADAPGVRYRHVELGGFSESEALAYFAQQEEQYPVVKQVFDLDFRRHLCQVTAGSPIRLDMAIYIAHHQLGLDAFIQEIKSMPHDRAREWLDRLLIEHVMQNEPDASLGMILRYLAVARKGLNASLLHHLAGEWSIDECQQRLDAVAERSFVKQRPADGRLFLHDAMYQICDQNLLNAPQVQELSHQIIAWYDARIEASDDAQKRGNYQIDSLLYRLRAAPRAGYHWYAKVVDEAIRYAEVGLDMQLRNEVLTFLSSPSPIDEQLLRDASGLPGEIDCDCAARWVKRFLSRGMNDEAIHVGETVNRAADELYHPGDPYSQLARADLNVYYALALIYTGKAEKGNAILRESITELEGGQRPEDVARQGDPHAFAGWRRNLALGRGHNNLGYAYWMERGHYALALQELRSAVPYFRASDLWEEYANTGDNMGRVYALLYQQSRAESLMDDSLELRRRLGRDYRTALSLNSRAIAHLAFREPHRARRLSEEALNIFERLGGQRGIGLASITLGRSLRSLGDLWTDRLYPSQECDRFFREATRLLERAVNIFKNDVHEPVRLIEAYNELGCTHRDRAAMAYGDDPRSPLARSISRDAVQYLTRCIQLAEETHPVLYVDSCEDLAQAFFQRQEYNYAEMWLQRAEDCIPDHYKLQKGAGLPDVPAEECVEEFWQQLGKLELQRGYFVYHLEPRQSDGKASRQVLERAMHHFAFAAAYFERFSERAAGLETTLKQLYDIFKQCKYDDLRHIQEQVLPDIASTFALDPTQLGKFFEDTLGLVLQLTR